VKAVEGVRHELAQSIQEWFQMPGTAGLISSLTMAGIQALKQRRGSGRRPSGHQRLRQRSGAADQENKPCNRQTDQHGLLGKSVAVAGEVQAVHQGQEWCTLHTHMFRTPQRHAALFIVVWHGHDMTGVPVTWITIFVPGICT
jgi:hypothetical protein